MPTVVDIHQSLIWLFDLIVFQQIENTAIPPQTGCRLLVLLSPSGTCSKFVPKVDSTFTSVSRQELVGYSPSFLSKHQFADDTLGLLP